jgi:hypothetical protein
MGKDKDKGKGETRIGRVERDKKLTELRLHFEAERITYQEFQERMEKALEAVTASDLAKLTADLPSPGPVPLPLEVRQHPMPARRRGVLPVDIAFWLVILTAWIVILLSQHGG